MNKRVYNKREATFQAVVDLHNADRVATRGVISEVTELPMGMVDDYVKALVNDGRLRRVSAGVFEPLEQFPEPRPVSVTSLPGGLSKVEIGDDCLDLIPTERRELGRLLAGSAAELAAINSQKELLDRIGELRRELVRERKERKRQAEVIHRLQRAISQADLFPS